MDVTLREITFGYNARQKIFENLSAHFESKKTHVVLGKSGSGKSTLLKLIAGELLPEQGAIESNGEVWKQLEESPIPGFRHVAFLNQEFDLLPYSTVKENIRRRLHGYGPQEEEDIIRDVALKLDISEILERRAVDISGGQKQRVAFAAALAKRPQVLLMDEPLSNQDFKNAENIKDIIQWLRGYKTLIISTHEGSEALQLADSISVLYNGKIVQIGSPREVYESPANEYVAGLLGHYNLVPVQWLTKNFGYRIDAQDSENVVLRPHKLILSRTHGIPCRVMRAEYLGMYYMVLIEADGYLLYVYYPHNHFAPKERWKVALQNH
ncbi:sugar ABC transporter ATP-binding protein [Thermaurantimonas aggregans]|uniref:Sugar ABC transporter ATP-binding protein n=1 Tax=Thermaurantimonas aggregans TaxID=2173829 RepID=A0A401XMY9_9FLAO|nr:ABC transporter ATP-binding protein [Thermaurantimonas aggregans]MCX8149753.1 ABC transporter ATP-binding protein [Thermaurantimonas aggregans]GCD78380.1 sugar ABC transporter ATP-binding protein [Thermaurantimonas aggregans]